MLFVEVVAVVLGQVHHHELVEGVGIPHQDHGPLGHPQGGAPQVEDATGGRERTDEEAPAGVERGTEFGEGHTGPPFPRGHDPLGQLSGRDGAVLQTGEVGGHAGRIGFTVQQKLVHRSQGPGGRKSGQHAA
jgi:hypothetical protein